MFPHKNILIVAAHPDDEVLGCGGVVARWTHEGARVVTLILGEGITSRGGKENPQALETLKTQAREANRIIGSDEVLFGDLPDNRFDTVPRLEIIQTIEREIARAQPDAIFTHHAGDLNVDHQVTHEAVLTAARPLPGSCVKMIAAFEILSSTEWSGSRASFQPNMYVDISGFLHKKTAAIETYSGEIRDFPHPRSKKGIEALALKRGTEAGLHAAEAFETIRMLV